MSSKPLARVLHRARGRWVLGRSVHWAVVPSLASVGLFASGALGCRWAAGAFSASFCRTFLGPVALSGLARASLLSCFLGIWAGALALACLRQRGVTGLMRMARLLDGRLGLADRLASAWWLTLSRPVLSSLERAAIADADRLAPTLDLAHALPLRRAWSLALCALGGVGLALLPVAPAAAPKPFLSERNTTPSQPASLIDEGGRLATPDEQPTAELARLAARLERALRQGAAGELSPGNAFQALHRVGQQSARIARRLSASNHARADALTASGESLQVASAFRAGDLQAAARALEALADRAGATPGGTSRAQLARALASAAHVGVAPGDRISDSAQALSGALERASQALTEQPERAAQALADAAAALRQVRRESDAAAALQSRAGAAQESLRQRAQASTGYDDRLRRFSQRARGRASAADRRGQASSRAVPRPTQAGDASGVTASGSPSVARKGGAESGLGAGLGRGSASGAEAPTTRRKTQRRVVLDSIDTGEGASSSQPVSGAAVRGAARDGFTRPSYRAAYRPYRRVAERALASDAIPAGYAETVRRYFQLIQPRHPSP